MIRVQKITYGLFALFVLGPTSGGVVMLKAGRQEVPGLNSGRACRPIPPEFSAVFPKLA